MPTSFTKLFKVVWWELDLKLFVFPVWQTKFRGFTNPFGKAKPVFL